MAKGTTMIELECRDGRKSFSITHADNILRMKFHASWHLPEDSEWSWTAEKGFEKKGKKESQPKAAASTEAE